MSTLSISSLSEIDWSHWQAKDPATLTFIIKDGQVLLIRKRRGLGAGKINGPGGRVEPGETHAECAIREVEEELHITPLNMQYHGECLFQFMDGYSIHVHTYSATDFEGTPQETDEAIPLWYSLPEIPYQEMWEDDHIWLPELLAGKRFRGKFLFDGDKMLDHQIELLD